MKKKYYLVVCFIVLFGVIGKISNCFLYFMFNFILGGYLMMFVNYSFNIFLIFWFCFINRCLCMCMRNLFFNFSEY